MGKQINFYMDENIQMSFIEYLEQNRFVFLDSNSGMIAQPYSTSIYSLYLYKQDYGDIIMCKDNAGMIDSIASPVIQFSKTIIKEEQKKILRGRLWISDQYYDESGRMIKKEKSFLKEYQVLTRWIKKYVPYQEIRVGDYFVKEYTSNELKVLQREGFILTM